MVAFFTNDFQLINIEKTAIIVGLGIDKADNGELEVTTQIAVPQASNQNSTNSDAILSAKGKTLYEALENISLKTGWYPKLTFCNLIILGKDLIYDDFMPIINYILTSNRFQNSAVVACSEVKAKEILNCSTPLDYISSFALQKILLRNLDRSSSVMVLDVRKLCALNGSHSAFFYMPMISQVKTDDKAKGGAEQSQSMQESESSTFKIKALSDSQSQSGAGGASQSSQGSQESMVFEASKTVAFANGKPACVFTKEQTNCYNMLMKEIKEAFIPVEIERADKKVDALISIVSNKPKIDLEIKEGLPKLKIELLLTCEKEETFEREDPVELAKSNKVSKEGLRALEEKLQKTIEELIKLCVQTNCDFFEIKEELYRYNSKHYLEFKDNILQTMSYEVEVKCKNYR